jgi:hypothetical protein
MFAVVSGCSAASTWRNLILQQFYEPNKITVTVHRPLKILTHMLPPQLFRTPDVKLEVEIVPCEPGAATN